MSVLFMAVTADAYELPLGVSERVRDLSLLTGISVGNIHSRISKERKGLRIKQGGKSGVKFVRVEIDEDDD